MRKVIWCFVAAGLLLSACAGGRLRVGKTAEGEVVEAEGRCPILTDEGSARTCSLAAAQKAAVERVVGVFVSARIRVEKAMLIEQNILAKSDGYVKKYDIVRERVTKDKYYSTTIRALVPPQPVAADLQNVIKSAAVGNPRVAVVLNEAVDGEATDRLSATQVLTEALLAQGFRVVDRASVAKVQGASLIKATESGDAAKVRELASPLQAEVLLVGSAQAMFNTDKGLGGLVSYRGSVSVQAIKAGTGEIVKSASSTMSAVDLNKPSASDKARENAARVVASDLVPDLAKVLAKKTSLVLAVTGVSSLSEVSDIQKAVQATPGVEEVYTRSYDQAGAVFEVETSIADSDAVAAAVQKIAGTPLKITELYKDRVTAEVQAK